MLKRPGKLIVYTLLYVNRFYFKTLRSTMRLTIDTPDQPITVQNWQAEITELAFWLRHITFDLIIEIEQVTPAFALDNGIIERR